MKACKFRRMAVRLGKSIHRAGPALLVAMTLSAGGAFAGRQGELDPSFGENGRLFVNAIGYSTAIAQQTDGRLLIAGQAGEAVAVLRLNPDGSRDDSFGNDGVARPDLFEDHIPFATDVVVQPDGRIIVAVTTLPPDWWDTGRSGFALVRLNPDGTVDTSFGKSGLVSATFGGSTEEISTIALLNDGRIVVVGSSNANDTFDAMIARFEANGELDQSFGMGPVAGATLVDVAGGHDHFSWLTLQADDKYVACTSRNSWDAGEPGVLAIRVNADGTLDSTFGVDGVSRVTAGALAALGACRAMPDGTLMLVGHSAGNDNRDIVFVRLMPDGAHDASFGDGGVSRIDLDGRHELRSMTLLADGRLSLFGSAVTTHGQPSTSLTSDHESVLMFIARFNPESGLPDPGFGGDGFTYIDFGEGNSRSWAIGERLIQQTDGKLVGVGTTYKTDVVNVPGAAAVVRVDSAGAGHVGFAGFLGVADLRASADEGPFEAIAAVVRTGGSTGVLSVDYDTVAATAQAPRDFTATSGTLTWTSGDTDTKFISVPISGAGAGTFWLKLSRSTGGLATSELRVSLGAGGSSSGNSAGNTGGGGASDIWLLVLLTMGAVYSAIRRCPGSG